MPCPQSRNFPPRPPFLRRIYVLVSQGGSAHAVSVGALLAQTQPAILVSPPSLLGRTSVGPGGPDTISVGAGLTLNDGTLSASLLDPSVLPTETALVSSDQIVVLNAGSLQVVAANQVRDLFTAGPNVTIDANGVISVSASGGGASYSLTSLSPVTSLTSEDLVGKVRLARIIPSPIRTSLMA